MTDDGEGIYRAEKLLAKRVNHGVTHYFVKWEDYSSRHNTWEPIEHIIDRRLIDDFEERQITRNRPRRVTRRSLPGRPRNQTRAAAANPSTSPNTSLPILNNPDEADSIERDVSTSVSDHEDSQSAENSEIIKPEVTSTTPSSTIAIATDGPDNHASNSDSHSCDVTPSPVKSDNIQRTASSCSEGKSLSRNNSPEGKRNLSQLEEDAAANFTDSIIETTTATCEVGTNNLNSNNNNSSSISSNNSSSCRSVKKPRLSTKPPILKTVVTEVTVNDHTITVCESRSVYGFFQDVRRNSVAVDTTLTSENRRDVDRHISNTIY